MAGTKFRSNRDVIIRSAKYGRSYEFKKGQVRDDVIPQMHQDLLNAGILPVDEEGAPVNVSEDTVIEAGDKKSKVILAPTDGEERKKQILEAIVAIVKRNDSGDFTGGNTPKAAVVTQLLGWRVDTKDVVEVWKEHKAELLKQ